jgi:glycosyltransferase involved in cell wall biosynthesis
LRTKILVVGVCGEGGVKGYVDLVASNCDSNKVEWHTTVTDRKVAELAPQKPFVKAHYLLGTYSPWSLPIRIVQLRRLLKQQRIDLIHLHTARAGLLGCLSTIGLPVSIVYTGHGWRSEYRKNDLSNPLYAFIERWICSRANMVTVICSRDREIAIKRGLVSSNKIITIDTRIDSKTFENIEPAKIASYKRRLRIPDSAYVIGMVGIMDKRKDPFTFIRAAAKLIEKVPDAYFLWIGGGELAEDAAKLAEQLNLNERLVISGMRPNSEMPILLHVINVLLFTSRFEGIPLSILESQAAACPVVSSAYPGVEELVEHGRTGYLFPVGDHKEAARLVIMILRDKEITQRMVDSATTLFLKKHSNPSLMARAYESIYVKATRNTFRN